VLRRIGSDDRTYLAGGGVIFLALVVWLMLPSSIEATASQQTDPKVPVHSQVPSTASKGLPKIWWLYTDNEFDTEAMSEMIYLYHFNTTAISFGYEVRMVNSWTAYDWLSENMIQRITKARMNAKADEGVHNMLKLALLLEHGGVLVNQFDTVVLSKEFRWLEDMFDHGVKEYQERFSC
jgi:hypothetical protein